MIILLKKFARYSLYLVARLVGRQVFVVESKRRNYQLFDLNTLAAYWRRDEAVTAYEDSMRATDMTWSDNIQKRFRYQSIYQLANQVVDRNPNGGDVAECGVWYGQSVHLIATILKRRRFSGRFHLFDSFEGMSEFTPRDRNERITLDEKGLQELNRRFTAQEDQVRANLAEFGFLDFHPGWVPTKFHEVEDRKFILVNVDLGLYQPTLDSVEFFLRRLVDGGAMIFNDYGFTQFPGSREAVDEVVVPFGPRMFYQLPCGGAFLIK